MGYKMNNKRMIPSVEASAREMVSDEIVPLKQKLHSKPFYQR